MCVCVRMYVCIRVCVRVCIYAHTCRIPVSFCLSDLVVHTVGSSSKSSKPHMRRSSQSGVSAYIYALQWFTHMIILVTIEKQEQY